MPATYDSIQTITTSGGATTSVSFQNISGSYTDLVMSIRPAGSTSYFYYRYNNDASSLYSSVGISGNYTTATGGRNGNISTGYINFNTSFNQYGGYILDIMNYSSTSTFKTLMARGAGADPSNKAVDVEYSTWASTAAITRIDIFANSGIINDGSIFALYGIKRA